MTPREIALDVINRGWNPVPVPHRGNWKEPSGKGWQMRVIGAADVSKYFNGDRMNVGVLLGESSGGLVDVDLDCAEAITIAPYLLPKTKAIFGRDSKRNSHWLYVADPVVPSDKADDPFPDPTDGTMLVELRTGGGGKGAQTVFPGSTHKSGEAITWDIAGDPTEISGVKLLARVRALAAYSLIARNWPGEGIPS
jgi:hypothetical protein